MLTLYHICFVLFSFHMYIFPNYSRVSCRYNVVLFQSFSVHFLKKEEYFYYLKILKKLALIEYYYVICMPCCPNWLIQNTLIATTTKTPQNKIKNRWCSEPSFLGFPLVSFIWNSSSVLVCETLDIFERIGQCFVLFLNRMPLIRVLFDVSSWLDPY